MNEPLSQIEQELAALRPAAVTPDLERRIAMGIAEHAVTRPPRADRSINRWLAWGAGAAAASIVIGAMVWRLRSDIKIEVPIADVRPQAPHIASKQERPTLLALHRALARSDESLEKLLNEHAPSGSAAATGISVPRAFAGGAAHMLFKTGDL